MNSKQLCMQLIAAESEAKVQEIVKQTPEMSKPGNWRPLDDRETNFNVTSNQASDGGKALTELMTNMVDAVLMKSAYEKGIDPRGSSAPATMYEAVDKLVHKMHGGKLTNLDHHDPWLRSFALKNLLIGVTGAKNKKQGLPCYTFADNGEGQKPENFNSTFLSLSAGNKREIEFVQGKYNMGSSGVLGYCGRNGYKLICSRRYDRKSRWGWTLIRKRPYAGMPIFESFQMLDKSIPQFDADRLCPFQTQDGIRFDGACFDSGTIIKLYDYQIGSGFLSFRGSRDALNENLVETILPFRILDFRQKPDKKKSGFRPLGIDERSFNGMEWLLLNTHSPTISDQDEEEELEDESIDAGDEALAAGRRISVGIVQHPELGVIKITAIVLKRDKLPDWLKTPRSNNRVFHAVNGQVQFKQTRGFLTDCGFPALKDRAVIVVDASNLKFSAHNEVWKGDREHTRNTILGEIYKESVKAAIRESDALKELQQEIAREELDSTRSKQSTELFQQLVNADKNLANLLSNRDPVIKFPSGGGTNGNSSGKGEFLDGKYHPTFFRIEEKVRSKTVDIPINKTRPIAGRTDVENGYFDRPDDTGRILIDDSITTLFAIRHHLHNGRLTLFVAPLESALEVGQEFTVRLRLLDSSMPEPVGDEFRLRVTEEEATLPKPKQEGNSVRQSGGASRKEGGNAESATHGLPNFQFLTRDGRMIGEVETRPWPAGFTEQDGGSVDDLGEGQRKFNINYDNAYHLTSKNKQRGDIAKKALTEKYKLGMLVLMLGYEHAIESLPDDIRTTLREGEDEFRRMAAKGAASTVLTLAEVLPRIVDTSSLETE